MVEARIPEMDSTNNYPWDVVRGLAKHATADTKLRSLQVAEGLASFGEKRKPSLCPAAA